jgi:predicted HicB family RNase H-like nuclease
MRDDLKAKAQQLAQEQGVSLNGFINATLAAAIAQQETLAFFVRRTC